MEREVMFVLSNISLAWRAIAVGWKKKIYSVNCGGCFPYAGDAKSRESEKSKSPHKES